jgi:hypothetical protein
MKFTMTKSFDTDAPNGSVAAGLVLAIDLPRKNRDEA